ncbi:MAG: 16S rRNA (uracil(1498)-N(3))-methyltransferase [Halioglobus sp.]
MRVPRIYSTQRLDTPVIELEPEPSRHVARALRMTPGDALTLFNGFGGEYRCTIISIDKKSVRVSIDSHEAVNNESSLPVHLGIALSRGERFDWVIQKATELGVYAIHPLFTENTGVKLAGDRAEKKHRHWQQIAISACEQCGRNTLPSIELPKPIGTWLDASSAALKLVMHTSVKNSLSTYSVPDSIDLLVGPEGGFSENEISAAEAKGFNAIQFGPRILRTETAPIAALAVLQAQWGDFNSL